MAEPTLFQAERDEGLRRLGENAASLRGRCWLLVSAAKRVPEGWYWF